MTAITINGPGFSFCAQFDNLPSWKAQEIAFEALQNLVSAERTLQAQGSVKFDVVLRNYPEGRKINMIKEIRTVTGLGIKEAKDLSESLPATIIRSITAVEAGQIVRAFTEAGGSAEVIGAAA